MKQEAVAWFPAYWRTAEKDKQHLLLKPEFISDAKHLEFPTLEQVFGRVVYKNLSIVLGPRFGHDRSLLVYESRWKDNPIFIPNFHWSEPLKAKGQQALIDREVREKLPFLSDVDFDVVCKKEWDSVSHKKTGDTRKAEVYGELANYHFRYSRIESEEIMATDPTKEFVDSKGHRCFFSTIPELRKHKPTESMNRDVLVFLDEFFRHIDSEERL